MAGEEVLLSSSHHFYFVVMFGLKVLIMHVDLLLSDHSWDQQLGLYLPWSLSGKSWQHSKFITLLPLWSLSKVTWSLSGKIIWLQLLYSAFCINSACRELGVKYTYNDHVTWDMGLSSGHKCGDWPQTLFFSTIIDSNRLHKAVGKRGPVVLRC